jgi:ATP-dependent phosphofructokinase / diphosphate-dependent phosphofructokinase
LGVTKAAETLGWQVIGFLDGFEGLLPPAQYIILDHSRTHGIMQQGGTILGTTSRGHFVAKVGAGEKTQVPAEIIEKARQTIADLEIDGLIVVGGDGSLTTAPAQISPAAELFTTLLRLAAPGRFARL